MTQSARSALRISPKASQLQTQVCTPRERVCKRGRAQCCAASTALPRGRKTAGGSATHRNDVHERRLARSVQANERQLHLLFEEQAAHDMPRTVSTRRRAPTFKPDASRVATATHARPWVRPLLRLRRTCAASRANTPTCPFWRRGEEEDAQARHTERRWAHAQAPRLSYECRATNELGGAAS